MAVLDPVTYSQEMQRFLAQKKQVAIYGGSFDPVHLGHLQTAAFVADHYDFDAILMMPNSAPPHKNGTKVSYEQRVRMLQTALEDFDDKRLCISLFEHDASQKHFTYNTLSQLRAAYPHITFSFIMGMDSFVALTSWKRGLELINLANIVVLQRPGSTLVTMAPPELLVSLQESHPYAYDILDSPEYPISSTEIRQAIQTYGALEKQQEQWDDNARQHYRQLQQYLGTFLTPKTLAFIKESQLYQQKAE